MMWLQDAAGVSATGWAGVVDLAAGVSGRGVDVVVATQLEMGVSGLMASVQHS